MHSIQMIRVDLEISQDRQNGVTVSLVIVSVNTSGVYGPTAEKWLGNVGLKYIFRLIGSDYLWSKVTPQFTRICCISYHNV